MQRRLLSVMACAGLAIAPAAFAQFVETEPNDTKAAANAFGPMVNGSTITGLSTGSSTTVPGIGSADNFRLTLGAAVPGIYRHRLVITSNTPGHTGSIRGLTQTAGVANAGSDAAVQSSSATSVPPRFNQFYSFGGASSLFYRVAGTTATTADYTVTMETAPVTAVDLGTFQPGSIMITTIGQGHTSDTDLWVYDSNFNAIPGFGNDDEFGTTSLGSRLTRNYAPGVYYLALTNFNLANDQTSPADDDFRAGALMDFSGVVANSSTTANVNLAFAVSDSAGVRQFASTKAGAFDINFFRFEVVPTPGAAALFGIAGLAGLRRRR